MKKFYIAPSVEACMIDGNDVVRTSNQPVDLGNGDIGLPGSVLFR